MGWWCQASSSPSARAAAVLRWLWDERNHCPADGRVIYRQSKSRRGLCSHGTLLPDRKRCERREVRSGSQRRSPCIARSRRPAETERRFPERSSGQAGFVLSSLPPVPVWQNPESRVANLRHHAAVQMARVRTENAPVEPSPLHSKGQPQEYTPVTASSEGSCERSFHVPPTFDRRVRPSPPEASHS